VAFAGDSTEPFETTIMINDKAYGTAAGINKKTAKNKAALETMEMLVPGFKVRCLCDFQLETECKKICHCLLRFPRADLLIKIKKEGLAHRPQVINGSDVSPIFIDNMIAYKKFSCPFSLGNFVCFYYLVKPRVGCRLRRQCQSSMLFVLLATYSVITDKTVVSSTRQKAHDEFESGMQSLVKIDD